MYHPTGRDANGLLTTPYGGTLEIVGILTSRLGGIAQVQWILRIPSGVPKDVVSNSGATFIGQSCAYG